MIYAVVAKAHYPCPMNKVVGYYKSEAVARYAAGLFCTLRGPSLSSFDFMCERYSGRPADSNAVVLNEVDQTEHERIVLLAPKLMGWKRKRTDSDSDSDSDVEPLLKKQRVISAEQQKATQVFQQGFVSAQNKAQEKYGDRYCKIVLSSKGSGIRAMTQGAFELEAIAIKAWKDGESEATISNDNIGLVDLQTDQLQSKTADQIAGEIGALVDQVLSPA